MVGPHELRIDADRETDGRWYAWRPALPGVMCYGADRADAVRRCKALAFDVIAEHIRDGEWALYALRPGGYRVAVVPCGDVKWKNRSDSGVSYGSY